MKNSKIYVALIIAGLIIIFLLQRRCSGNITAELKTNPEITKRDYIIDSLKHTISDKDKSKDSILRKNDLLTFNLSKSQNKLSQIKIQVDKDKKAFKELINSNRGEIATFYSNRYNLPNEAKTTPQGTEISDSLAYLNISELYDLDGFKKELALCGLIGQKKDSLISNYTDLWKLTERQKTDALNMYQLENEKFNIASAELQKEKQANSKEVTFRFLLGGGFGVEKTLNQFIYKANTGFQTRNGNVYIGSFNRIAETDFVTIDANFSIFYLKGKKK